MSNLAYKTSFRYTEEIEEKLKRVENIFPITRARLFNEAINEKLDEMLLAAEILERVKEAKSENAKFYDMDEIIKEFDIKI